MTLLPLTEFIFFNKSNTPKRPPQHQDSDVSLKITRPENKTYMYSSMHAFIKPLNEARVK